MLDSELSDTLDVLVREVADEQPAWDEILRDAGLARAPRVPASSRFGRFAWAPRRKAIRFVLASGALAAAALTAFALVPSGSAGCTRPVLSCAAAAVTASGPIVHLTVGIPGPTSTAAHPYPSRGALWYDSETGAYHSAIHFKGTAGTSEWWMTPAGDYYTNTYDKASNSYPPGSPVTKTGSRANGDLPELAAMKFFGSYLQQLRDGTATLSGSTTFRGHDAYLIDFPFTVDTDPLGGRHHISIRVIVDKQTYQPLGLGQAEGARWIPFFTDPSKGENGPKVDVSMLIFSASFEPRDNSLFAVPQQ